MVSPSLVIAEPRGGARLTLGADPILTEPIRLRAILTHGTRDVTSLARVNWMLSWQGTYQAYRYTIAKGADVITRLSTGGHLIRATADYDGSTFEAFVKIRVNGTNPSRQQVEAWIGNNDVLKAICWQESSWRQFDGRHNPLKHRLSSARGIAQVVEKWWRNSTVIHHNEYHRIAWQWSYCIEASRDIFAYVLTRAHQKFPDELDATVLDRAIKAYNVGSRSLNTLSDPATHDYVQSIHRVLALKPWSRKQ